MNEYTFNVLITSNGENFNVSHTIFSRNYRDSYSRLLNEIPKEYPCEYFIIGPFYCVNGKSRRVK